MTDSLGAAAQSLSPRPLRALLYSHDTFGLGHLRRSRAIAAALVEAFPGLSCLIVTGSPVAGRFSFPPGVDHIRLPGVTKLHDGSYISESLGLDIDETTHLRAALLRAAAADFDPDLVIVDKEPAGFRGEMIPALEHLQGRGRARLVLGLRDVLDAPEALAAEWARKNALEITEQYYDQAWVYGLQDIYDPLNGLDVSEELRRRMRYTGYIRRAADGGDPPVKPPYVLITAGGGGDGAALIHWVLSAYETDPDLSPPALIVYGPFVDDSAHGDFKARVAALGDRVSATRFHPRMEALMTHASGVVAMGGYNTFCEILSFDKAAVISPRSEPRLEQYIRAAAAEQLGLTAMVDPVRDGGRPEIMAAAIRRLATQPRPSSAGSPHLLGGLETIVDLTRALLSRPARRQETPA